MEPALPEPPLDDSAKAKLGTQALGWLKAELNAAKPFWSGEGEPKLMGSPDSQQGVTAPAFHFAFGRSIL